MRFFLAFLNNISILGTKIHKKRPSFPFKEEAWGYE